MRMRRIIVVLIIALLALEADAQYRRRAPKRPGGGAKKPEKGADY